MRARDGVLVIQTLLWPDEVRAAEFPSLDDVEKPKAKELKMAQTLVESMAGDFDPTEFTDDYQLQLRQLLDEMIENGGKKVIPAAEVDQEGTDAEVVDLVAALQRSVDEAKSNASKAGSSKSTTPRKKRA